MPTGLLYVVEAGQDKTEGREKREDLGVKGHHQRHSNEDDRERWLGKNLSQGYNKISDHEE